jgi:iron complex outermembrane receptor protein
MSYKVFVYLLLVCPFIFWAQTFPEQNLDTVYLVDRQLKVFNTGQKQLQLTDSVIAHNSFSLNDILNRETPIYFKQNGYGMVSSPSFRGTTAQQTAVLWNGININSQLTGQADFNTLLSANFSSIDVKYGGGSVLYGTGAIGGTVHLNSGFSADENQHHFFQSGYGSFNSYELNYNFQEKIDQFQFKIGFARRQSDNDYEIPEQNRDNINGQFHMNSLDAAMRYQIDRKNTLNYYGNLTFGDRNFSVIRATDPKAKYENIESRNLLEWQLKSNAVQTNLKVAYLTEEFSYIDNIERENTIPSTSSVETAWLQYEFWYRLKNITINTVLNYQNNQAEGNNFNSPDRDLLGLSALFKHNLSKSFIYEVSLRQDFNSDFENPFLFSLGSTYQFSDDFGINFHVSKNYRIPTFNDLFWQNGGNPNLVPEESYQTELGFVYENGLINASLTGFYYDISDMIRWLPNEFGVWQPQNTDEVESYGLEAEIGLSTKVFQNDLLQVKGMYSYTISENVLTGNQLIFVPIHLYRLNLNYAYKQWSLGIYNQFTGEVFTQSDNNPERTIEQYILFDADLTWRIPYLKSTRLSFRALNLFDLAYEVVENRPMPGQSFSINLITQF